MHIFRQYTYSVLNYEIYLYIVFGISFLGYHFGEFPYERSPGDKTLTF